MNSYPYHMMVDLVREHHQELYRDVAEGGRTPPSTRRPTLPRLRLPALRRLLPTSW